MYQKWNVEYKILYQKYFGHLHLRSKKLLAIFFAPRKIVNIGTIAVFIVAPLKLQIAVANLANTLFLY